MATEQAARTQGMGMRVAAIMLGPPLVLDGVVAAGILAASAAAWEQGRRSGRPLWKLVAVGALLPWAYRLLMRTKWMRLGSTRKEVLQPLPGDELIAHRNVPEFTHAITVRARPEDVWPWLVQIGAGERGGFYSYDWLERLVGAPVHSSARILPEHQNPKAGDPVIPDGAWRVLRVDPGRAFVIGNQDFTWAFIPQPLDGEKTRLLVRIRVSPGQTGSVLANLITLPHLIMQQKMLKGLRRRAEQTARSRGG
jgi:hypothetical protein